MYVYLVETPHRNIYRIPLPSNPPGSSLHGNAIIAATLWIVIPSTITFLAERRATRKLLQFGLQAGQRFLLITAGLSGREVSLYRACLKT